MKRISNGNAIASKKPGSFVNAQKTARHEKEIIPINLDEKAAKHQSIGTKKARCKKMFFLHQLASRHRGEKISSAHNNNQNFFNKF